MSERRLSLRDSRRLRLIRLSTEGQRDDILDRRVLNGQVENRQVAQKSIGDSRGRFLGDAEHDLPLLPLKDISEGREVVAVSLMVQIDLDDLERGQPRGQVAEQAVKENAPVVDDDDPLAQRRDVGHVVAGENQRGPVAPVVIGDEVADARLHGDIDADRRFIEKEHVGPVEQRDADLAFHALAERQGAHLLLEDVADIQQCDQLVEGLLICSFGQVVHRGVDQERVHRRQVPAQLAALAHEHADPAQIGRLAPPRNMPHDRAGARRRVQQPRHHLQRRRLSRPVGTEETDDLALFNGETDLLDGADLLVPAPNDGTHRRPEAALALGHTKGLGQCADFNLWHGGMLMEANPLGTQAQREGRTGKTGLIFSHPQEPR